MRIGDKFNLGVVVIARTKDYIDLRVQRRDSGWQAHTFFAKWCSRQKHASSSPDDFPFFRHSLGSKFGGARKRTTSRSLGGKWFYERSGNRIPFSARIYCLVVCSRRMHFSCIHFSSEKHEQSTTAPDQRIRPSFTNVLHFQRNLTRSLFV